MPGEAPDDASIREATPGDRVAVARVLDGALLEVEGLPDRLRDGTVLAAGANDAIVGAVVVAPAGPAERSPPDWPDASHVRSIAVRRKHRRRGIGTALLLSARARWGPLVADSDADREVFYSALAAECRVGPDGRHWALLREP